MINITALIKQLRDEKNMKYKGEIYYLTQIEFAYNNNRIEGSKLSKEHTQYLFERAYILTNKNEIFILYSKFYHNIKSFYSISVKTFSIRVDFL